MKKIIPLALICLLSTICFLSAEEAPMAGSGWYWTDGTKQTIYLWGVPYTEDKHFLYSDTYKEQDGYALVNGEKVHYWLYNSTANHNGKTDVIYNKIIPNWVEKKGYVIDYDNIEVVDPNPNLANSVRMLMKQRGADVSVALVPQYISGASSDFVVINEFFASKNSYKTTTYNLYR